jgi:hypothetical protein
MNYFQVLSSLQKIYDDLKDKELSSNAILNRIKKCVNLSECLFIKIDTISLPCGRFMVSGLYDPSKDKIGAPPILIEIAFPKKSKFKFDNFDIRRDEWIEFCVEITSTIGHEFVHLTQFRKRNFLPSKLYSSKSKILVIKEMQEYYGDPDEIDAYAFIAATELYLNKLFQPKKQFVLKTTKIFKIYVKVFKKNDPVLIRLAKKTNQHLKILERQYHAAKL